MSLENGKNQTIENEFIKKYHLPKDSSFDIDKQISNLIIQKGFLSLEEAPILPLIKSLMLKQFIFFGFLKLCSSVFLYLSFVFLDMLTENLKVYFHSSIEEDTRIFLLCSGIITNIFINAYLTTHCNWRKERLKIHLKTIFRIFIFSKILNSSQIVPKSKGIDVNNLYTADVEEASNFVFGFHYSWISALEILFCLLFLYMKIHGSVVYILVVLGGLFFLNFVLSYVFRMLYGEIVQQKDARISLTKNIIQGIKSIKFLSWEEIFKKKLDGTRKEEFNCLVLIKITSMIQELFWSSFTYLIVFACLIGYTYYDNSLSQTNIFTVNYLL